MAIDHEVKDKKLQYDINREAAEYEHYHLEKLINMNILQVKECYFLIEDK